MGKAYFGADEIAMDAYAILHGVSEPEITLYPRTIGGIISESGVVDKTLSLKSFQIFPNGTDRSDVEYYFNQLNERMALTENTLSINGNTYLKMNVKNINWDFFITKKFAKFNIDFQMNNQDTGSTIRQLSCAGLENFSRGRKLRFKTTLEDNSIRTFNFWHNFDIIRNLEVQLTVQDGGRNSTGRIVKTGGFEKIICHGWIIGPEVNNRQNIEAYFYNIVNGPLGRLGTVYLDDQIWYKCFLSEVTMEDTQKFAIKYELTFISSLQC